LAALPGIGPVLASCIVADRDTHGPFKSVDDLMRVPGIKDGLLAKVREFVTVSP
jgi:competence protein ComEA